jgi:hypothetical protein
MDKLSAGTLRTVNVDDDVDLGVVLDRVSGMRA